MRRAFIGLGSNLGDRAENCRAALEMMERHQDIEVIRCSSLYETEPVGIDSDRWFINAVAEIVTSLGPRELLQELLLVEAGMGRDRSQGPDRVIDLDILMIEGIIEDGANGPEIPHPRFHERPFVLVPWSEIAPDTIVEPMGKSIAELLSLLPPGQPEIRLLEPAAGAAA